VASCPSTTTTKYCLAVMLVPRKSGIKWRLCEIIPQSFKCPFFALFVCIEVVKCGKGKFSPHDQRGKDTQTRELKSYPSDTIWNLSKLVGTETTKEPDPCRLVSCRPGPRPGEFITHRSYLFFCRAIRTRPCPLGALSVISHDSGPLVTGACSPLNTTHRSCVAFLLRRRGTFLTLSRLHEHYCIARKTRRVGYGGCWWPKACF
jgi:hypothetical protein